MFVPDVRQCSLSALALASLLACDNPAPRDPVGTAAGHTSRPNADRAEPRPFARCVAPKSPDSSGSDAGFAPTSVALTGVEETDAGSSVPVPGAGRVPIPDADHTIASLRPEFRRCYQAGLNVDHLMQGCVIMAARISPEGEVTSNDTVRREGLSPEVATCLVDVVKGARFTAPGGGGSTLMIPVTFVAKP